MNKDLEYISNLYFVRPSNKNNKCLIDHKMLFRKYDWAANSVFIYSFYNGVLQFI